MLVAIEGPDRAGKTTLFNALREELLGPVYVPSLPFDPSEAPYIDLLSRRLIALWTALYDPSQVYVCDRLLFVSNPVYAKAYNRVPVDYPDWNPRIRVLYIDAPKELLLSRPDALPQNYDKVIPAYGELLNRWTWSQVYATTSLTSQVADAKATIRFWAKDRML